MGGIHIDLGRIGGTRGGAASVGIVALAALLVLVDFVALRGERVALGGAIGGAGQRFLATQPARPLGG